MIGVLNQAQSEVRFVMDPYEQLHAFDWIEANGLDLVGIFHSHPTGPETASATDIAEAAYCVVHLILAPRDGQWQARGFWIEAGTAREVALQITG
jgi:proteasome lid subunit RPN8/RPN11